MRMLEKIITSGTAVFALILGVAGSSPLLAADQEGAPKNAVPYVHMNLEQQAAGVARVQGAKFSKEGAQTCVGCHDDSNPYPIYPIFKTKHATLSDDRTPFSHENKQCEACHGPGALHAKAKKSEKRSGTIINFGKHAWTPVKDQNDKCLACHQTHQRIEWKGSTHEFNDVACASCHTIHVAKDPVLDRQEQARICMTCHTSQKAKFYELSHHPVREGQMACSECHNVHGENGTGLRIKATSREKCVSCHADKRGPFLWDHAPAAEDCTLCHDPHGSNQPALLKKRVPQLCQECHSPSEHSANNLLGGSQLGNSAYLQVKGCLNCHNQVHGSNHPSGANLLR